MPLPNVLLAVKWLLALPTLLIALTACAGDGENTPSTSADVSRAAVRDGGVSRMLAGFHGTLRADPESGCLWLEGESGQPTAQLLLQGDSYRVDFSDYPATVRNGDAVVATVGQQVDGGGGYTTRVQGVAGCPVDASTFLGYFPNP